jgi:hypothetical protein
MKLVANDIDPFTLEKEDIGTDTIVVKNGATELKEGVDYVIGESKKTIRLITNITIATGESLTVDYKYEVEPACAYRYDEELQMIVPIAGEEKPEEGNEEVSEKEGTVPEEGEETPEDKVEETPEEYIKKGDEILEKTPENQKKWNKGEALNQTEKSYFYVVIEMIYTLPESDQKTELINLLEGGKLGDFQRKIGVPEQVNGEYLIDGCFGKITLYYLQVYLKITITVPVPGRIKEEPKYLIGETPADPI